ncbi:MAG: carbohydrate-binding protein [Actinobacteria bacterium]|nr:MAG: carbohydrate-binding protein [Actinomycetota bacterium]
MAGIRVARTAAALAALALVSAGWTGSASAATSPAASVFNVRTFGATGDGITNDTPAVNAAIAAANGAGGGTVEFPAGTYLAGGSIHLLSNVTLLLDAGSTLLGAASGYDVPEPNPNDAFQDFGHSHFHDAMIWGDNLTNIGFTGSGVIDGGGHFITGNPKPGQADKLIALTRCTGLTVNGITLRRGGHFAMLTNGCDHVVSDHLTIDTASDRDGWNVISTRDVLITNANIAANDDALAFKSDWALGATLPNGNVTVLNAHLSARCCNGLMFGSETCGDFSNYWFSHITITGAGKSGLGMVSMDGAHISHVYYNDITLSGTASPITEKVGARHRCGNSPGIGSISDIHYTNITGTQAGVFSPTLWGQPGHEISDVTFQNVQLTLPGGRPAMDPNALPSDNGDYNPNSLSTRPAYGFYLHNVVGVTFDNSRFDLAADDARPAIIANTGSRVSLHHVTVQRGTGSPFDVGFQSVAGYCTAGSRTGTGGASRLSTPGSTPACVAGVDNFTLGVTPAAQTGTAGSSVTYTVHTGVASGRPGPVTLTATGAPPGAQVTFNPNPVQPGHDATMTVTTQPTTRNDPYRITVVGSDPGATQYAQAGLTVTGGVDLTITGLTVADPANAANWSVQSNLQPGVVLYGDRTYTLPGIPAPVIGARWIRTANNSAKATADPLVTFTITAPATIAVAVDTRQAIPPWIDASWTDTGTQLSDFEGGTTFRRFEIYTRPFAAGPVPLGPAATTTADMYVILVL